MSNLKAIANDKIYVAKKLEFLYDMVKKHYQKKENRPMFFFSLKPISFKGLNYPASHGTWLNLY